MRYELDTKGHLCPYPLMQAKKKIVELQIGDELAIQFTCAEATENLPRWAAENDYPVIHFAQIGDATWEIVIKKA
ncbi:sulfurtransferase TusA family protein [Volucribacter amazonae]|uniref:Oxidoreductase n=1 Tax=Volucribacter amazonae TaxID=256731 RepID=A0A9X4SH27_9PAST|nr:sulfurtransferase TusA family protein [Volucribacter amazonae]MDG6894222.1 oxidoreductase [Volucribacter amazonae]